MPKAVFEAELETVRTAIYLNPKEEAPWLYYNWLLKQLLPVLVLTIKPLHNDADSSKHSAFGVLLSQNIESFN
jgi:hypothetical protein